ncbi:MAG: hypothetical protein C5B57_04350 [Blastocatellia bacterium]|nr:MAG: hypothetical protein C5B57_04350 [Blastocatellia bacterium]
MILQRAGRSALSIDGLVVVLVLFRMIVWIAWEQSYFDSDQATTGLMAKHLAQLKAFPLFFYGQQYMLGIESWFVAPLFVFLAPSVFLLKLPLVIINIVVGLLLTTTLVGEAGLARWASVLASLFFLVPPPIAASRLAEASGVNLEPFLYTLLLWRTRERPLLFGAIAGVGFAHREFTAYPVLAVLLLDVLHRRFPTRAGLSRWAIVFAAVFAVMGVSWLLKPHADLYGPGTAGTLASELRSQSEVVTQRLGFNAGEVVPNLKWLFTTNLGALFGWRPSALADYFINSSLTVGHVWAWVPFAVLTLIVTIAAIGRVRRSQPTSVGRSDFPVFLMLVGLQAMLVYTFLSCLVRDIMLIRYTLLTLFLPVGALAWLFASNRSTTLRSVAVVATLLWSAAALWDQGRVLTEYVHEPPSNDFRKLATYLERTGVRYGEAPYWTAYTIDFLTNERIILRSSEVVRITMYDDLFRQHEDEAVSIVNAPACVGNNNVRLLRWCVRNVSR